jgi:predicted GNAT family N-acyltransferase
MIEYKIEFWKHLAIDSITSDEYFIFASGLQTPLINLVLFKDQSIAALKNALPIAEGFFKKHKLPWGINIIDDEYSKEIIEILINLGYKSINQEYEIDSKISSLNIKNTSGIPNITEIAKSSELKNWVKPISSAFEIDDQDSKLYLQLITKSFKSDSNILRHFTLYDNDQPISSASLCFFDKIARLDNVSTIKEKQSQGFGNKIVQFCINQSIQKGCNRMIFESSEDGINFYKKLGFSKTTKSYIYSLSER